MVMAMVAMFSTALLVVLLLINDSAPLNIEGTAMVDIYHDIQGSDPIQVDCTKGNDQFATRTLHYGQRFVWGFKPNFWGVTKYYCTFTWNPPQGSYKVRLRVWTDYKFFSHDPQRPCTRCVWRVASDGFYRMTSDSGEGPVYASGWICAVNCY